VIAGSGPGRPARARVPLRLPATVVVVLLALVASACTGLPEDGPVVVAEQSEGSGAGRAFDLDAVPPREGATQVETVRGFLDAMTASPVRLDVAREYLTTASAEQWNPEAATITYGDRSSERIRGGEVSVRLADAQRLDGAGVWRGRLGRAEETLRFSVALEDGEYRVVDPPNALVVPTTWFTQRFSQAATYYFDPSGRVLVPQPVFVPRGAQLGSALVDALVRGPGGQLREYRGGDRGGAPGGVVRSFLPPGLRVGVSVPVSSAGVALVELVGDTAPVTEEEGVRLLAQLAWTLRQVPGVTAVRATLGGRPVRTPSGGEEYAVSQAIDFDPLGPRASSLLFAWRDEALSRVSDGVLVPVEDPFPGGSDVRAVALSLAADRVAGVSGGGTRLLVGAVGAVGSGESAPTKETTRAKTVLTDGRGLLRPVWDLFDRTWVVDTGPAGGARVRYVADGRVRRVEVPGITGRRVTAFVVSRDGTRLVAVVRGSASTDVVKVARIRTGARGRVVGATAAMPLDRSATAQGPLLDLAWTSPTTVAVLTAVVPDELYETRSLSVDGAPSSLVVRAPDAGRLLSTSVSAPVAGLAASPDPEVERYAWTDTGLVDLDTGITEPFRTAEAPGSSGAPEGSEVSGVSWVGYVG